MANELPENTPGDPEQLHQKLRDLEAENGRLRSAEAALRDSEERSRHLADSAPVAVWVTDPGGACTYVNPHWLRLTGSTLEQNLGSGWLDFLHPNDRART